MSTIKVDNLLNSTGDQDSGIDLSTNDQILMKTANTTAVTINSSQAVTLAGNLSVSGNLTVSGTSNISGDFVKLLDATISSAVSYYDIDSTYINSTYDSYEVEFVLRSASDNDHLRLRTFVGGTLQTGTVYGWAVGSQGDTNVGASSASNGMRLNRFSVGNETGAFIGGRMRLQNVNSTSKPYFHVGTSVSYAYSSGSFTGTGFSGGMILANRADVVNGIRFYYANNIESGTIKLYGIK